MKYKPGDIKKLFGISNETLRFFEEKGLVRPEREIKNNYRVFDTLDLNKIVAYKLYRGFEFSMDDAMTMVKCGNENQLNLIKEQKEIIKSKKLYYDDLYTHIKNIEHNYQRLSELKGRIVVDESPSLLIYYNQKDDKFNFDMHHQLATQSWIKCVPYINIAFYVKQEHGKFEPNIHYGYSLDIRYEKIKELVKDYVTIKFPSCLCVHTLFEFGDAQTFDPRDIYKLSTYAEENGYMVTGDFYGCLVNEEDLGDTKVAYLEGWLPVKKKL